MKHYQAKERLEAEIKLESEQYAPATKRSNFAFQPTQGPVVKVLVEGAKIAPERVKHMIPVYEEGTVDEDLLNEGNRRLRDYYQRLGYFDVKVDHQEQIEQRREVDDPVHRGPGSAPARAAGGGRGKSLLRLGYAAKNCSAYTPPIRSTGTEPIARRWFRPM